MFDFTARIQIEAPPQVVWDEFEKIDQCWVLSKSDHESLDILSGPMALRAGVRICVWERIAGIPGVAEGSVTGFEPGEYATWKAGPVTLPHPLPPSERANGLVANYSPPSLNTLQYAADSRRRLLEYREVSRPFGGN